ncbi:MAG: hypothetical protein NXI32_07755 [bacterium]|nr:hypothetical protein [bacterium]
MPKISMLSTACLLCALTACQPNKSTPSQSTAEQPSIQAQKATAGVGKKGQSLQDNEGVAKIIAGPLAAMTKVEQIVTFDIQVKKALDLFKALEGREPNSHEEFMSKVIQANRIQLPELPEGAVYHFNTQKGELWVYPEDEVPHP